MATILYGLTKNSHKCIKCNKDTYGISCVNYEIYNFICENCHIKAIALAVIEGNVKASDIIFKIN